MFCVTCDPGRSTSKELWRASQLSSVLGVGAMGPVTSFPVLRSNMTILSVAASALAASTWATNQTLSVHWLPSTLTAPLEELHNQFSFLEHLLHIEKITDILYKYQKHTCKKTAITRQRKTKKHRSIIFNNTFLHIF